MLLGVVHGAVCFFIPYYSLATSGTHNVTDVYSLGKIAFVALLGAVTLEVALVARYWTWLFGVFTVLSYALVYPYLIIFPLAGARAPCLGRPRCSSCLEGAAAGAVGHPRAVLGGGLAC